MALAINAEMMAKVAALIGPRGERLARLPGHIAYWFAYSGFAAGEAALGE